MTRIFISYVRENREIVDLLVKDLRACGVSVWQDRTDLGLGSRWKEAIREAIQNGDFFAACFSKEFKERRKSYMNEELTLAIDELRTRPSDRSWFLPILLNETSIPPRRISSVEELGDIQAIELYENWRGGINQILRALTCDDPNLARVWRLVEIVDGFFARERRHAIQQLGLLRVELDITSVEVPIGQALAKSAMDCDDEVKAASLQALTMFGRPFAEVIPSLIATLSSPRELIRKLAGRAFYAMANAEGVYDIAEFSYEGTGSVQNSILAKRRAAQAFAIAAAEKGVPALIGILNNDPSWHVRGWASLTLGSLEKFATKDIAERLKKEREAFEARVETEGEEWPRIRFF